MKPVIQCCAGLDVHKKTVVACVLRGDPAAPDSQEIRTYDTVTRGLLAMLDWFQAAGVTHVAMESTGVYWKPVFNILDGHFEQVMLVNAAHLKQVPGRKTDVKDCAWIASLLIHGLLRPSFVPSEDIRELRDLTRSRTKLQHEKSAVANRLQKILEDANLKLASVLSDPLGVSGRAMIRAMIAGETSPDELAELARGRLRKKLPALRSALHGRITPHHRYMLSLYLRQWEYHEALIEEVTTRIEEAMVPFAAEVDLITTIPGIGKRTAQNVLAEIGPDMGQFPSAKHLASWVGVCPGNKRSGGKRLSGRTAHGNRWCRGALNEAAWAATRARRGNFSSLYRRIASRRGGKRAIVAVGHALLGTVYAVLVTKQPFSALPADHLEKRDKERKARYHLERLKRLGVNVTVVQEAA